QMTANLAGPIVVNVAERLACQVVVEDGQWSTKHPVFVGSGGEEQSASAAA
ncbi:MAG: flagellar assembly protein FliW, partial [Armatimonadota bacterium]